MLTKEENLKYQLETLASYEPSDLDNPEFEVAYENESGNEGFATVCCVDVAKRSLERIKELENNQIEFAKAVLLSVGGDINEENRLTKNSKSYAVAIVLNKLQDIAPK